jgi:hypothetical protein
MRGLIRVVAVSGVLLFTVASVVAKFAASPADDRDSIVIVYKDGHRQSLVSTEISRIDLKAPAVIVYKDGHREKVSAEIDRIEFGPPEMAMTPGRRHFVGRLAKATGATSTSPLTRTERRGRVSAHRTAHGLWWTARPASAGRMAGTT